MFASRRGRSSAVMWPTRLTWAPVDFAGLFLVRLRRFPDSHACRRTADRVFPYRSVCLSTLANSGSYTSNRLSGSPGSATTLS